MNWFDFLLTPQQKRNQAATRIALQSGRFVSCPVCHGVTEARQSQAYREQTRRLVHRMVVERQPEIELFDRDEEKILQTIDRVAKDLPYFCACEDY
jgi:hypothetical protein